jgi:hypothetical protein
LDDLKSERTLNKISTSGIVVNQVDDGRIVNDDAGAIKDGAIIVRDSWHGIV